MAPHVVEQKLFQGIEGLCLPLGVFATTKNGGEVLDPLTQPLLNYIGCHITIK